MSLQVYFCCHVAFYFPLYGNVATITFLVQTYSVFVWQTFAPMFSKIQCARPNSFDLSR